MSSPQRSNQGQSRDRSSGLPRNQLNLPHKNIIASTGKNTLSKKLETKSFPLKQFPHSKQGKLNIPYQNKPRQNEPKTSNSPPQKQIRKHIVDLKQQNKQEQNDKIFQDQHKIFEHVQQDEQNIEQSVAEVTNGEELERKKSDLQTKKILFQKQLEEEERDQVNIFDSYTPKYDEVSEHDSVHTFVPNLYHQQNDFINKTQSVQIEKPKQRELLFGNLEQEDARSQTNSNQQQDHASSTSKENDKTDLVKTSEPNKKCCKGHSDSSSPVHNNNTVHEKSDKSNQLEGSDEIEGAFPSSHCFCSPKLIIVFPEKESFIKSSNAGETSSAVKSSNAVESLSAVKSSNPQMQEIALSLNMSNTTSNQSQTKSNILKKIMTKTKHKSKYESYGKYIANELIDMTESSAELCLTLMNDAIQKSSTGELKQTSKLHTI